MVLKTKWVKPGGPNEGGDRRPTGAKRRRRNRSSKAGQPPVSPQARIHGSAAQIALGGGSADGSRDGSHAFENGDGDGGEDLDFSDLDDRLNMARSHSFESHSSDLMGKSSIESPTSEASAATAVAAAAAAAAAAAGLVGPAGAKQPRHRLMQSFAGGAPSGANPAPTLPPPRTGAPPLPPPRQGSEPLRASKRPRIPSKKIIGLDEVTRVGWPSPHLTTDH